MTKQYMILLAKYHNDMFEFVKVMNKLLLVSFFLDTLYVFILYSVTLYCITRKTMNK